jgi:hypothetical protein
VVTDPLLVEVDEVLGHVCSFARAYAVWSASIFSTNGGSPIRQVVGGYPPTRNRMPVLEWQRRPNGFIARS